MKKLLQHLAFGLLLWQPFGAFAQQTIQPSYMPNLQTWQNPSCAPKPAAPANPSALKVEERPALGVRLRESDNLVWIEWVNAGSAAEKAGLRIGDKLLKINNNQLVSVSQTVDAITQKKVGDVVEITYQRGDTTGQAKATLQVAATETRVYSREVPREYRTNHLHIRSAAKEAKACETLAEIQSYPFLGVYIDVWKESSTEGASISSIAPNTGAAKAKLQAGDLIVKINQQDVRTYEDLVRTVKSHRVGDKLSVHVMRNGKNMRVTAILGSHGDLEPLYIQSLEKLCAEQSAANAPKPSQPAPALNASLLPTLELLPNPSTDGQVRLQISGKTAPVQVAVFGMDGRNVLQYEIADFSGNTLRELDLRNEPSGLYLVSIRQGEAIVTKQLVINK